MNNYADGGAKKADDSLKAHLRGRRKLEFHKSCFNLSFVMALKRSNTVIILNFFDLKSIFILFILLFQKNKVIYFSTKGQLMPEAVMIKSNRKLIFIKLIRLFSIFLDIRLIFTSMKEAISSGGTGFKEFSIIGDLVSDYSTGENEVKGLDLHKTKYTYGYFGRVDRKKNLQFLFPILNELNIRSFVIWGLCSDLPYLNELVDCARDSNVTVEYKGAYSRDDFFNIRASIDVLLMPTLAENFGYNILEAKLMGMGVCISKQTTPWDCEFDKLSNCEHVRFLELKQQAWMSELLEVTPCQQSCDFSDFLDELKSDRVAQLELFLESVQT